MFHVEHIHIFKMWKWSPHVDHAFNGGFIMNTKEKTKKAPYSKAELIKKIQSQDDRFEKPALLRINITHLGYILDNLG